MSNNWMDIHTKRMRSRVVGSAGGLAFMAGVILAGKVMIMMGMFVPGKTPNSEILDYWIGFLVGGCLAGFPAAFGARMLFDRLHSE
ncbi:hypothetical protein VN12_04685 [Pirellula sp. SH-Sr6A]|uniref:hypothetical protein n=1 Tax=Pirellula sp. SH-Sr6A TaxID=1632865 RepID=UPI00078CC264|nr:hypothetical protein [Pirellula sp. SH-Sr6A]AMV31391.1 hypothetical protein VN12_04685 [Pirellula sp. SH-Sr6A]